MFLHQHHAGLPFAHTVEVQLVADAGHRFLHESSNEQQIVAEGKQDQCACKNLGHPCSRLSLQAPVT